MPDRNFVSVSLCRRLAKAIGDKWASGTWFRIGRRWRLFATCAYRTSSASGAVPAYGIGDLAAWCDARRLNLSVYRVWYDARGKYLALVHAQGRERDDEGFANGPVNAAALAVLAAAAELEARADAMSEQTEVDPGPMRLKPKSSVRVTATVRQVRKGKLSLPGDPA